MPAENKGTPHRSTALQICVGGRDIILKSGTGTNVSLIHGMEEAAEMLGRTWFRHYSVNDGKLGRGGSLPYLSFVEGVAGGVLYTTFLATGG